MTKRSIMAQQGQKIADQSLFSANPSPLDCVLTLGAVNCEKARELCALMHPQCFVAVDIAGDFLHLAVAGLRGSSPGLDVRTVVADLNEEITLLGELLIRPDDVCIHVFWWERCPRRHRTCSPPHMAQAAGLAHGFYRGFVGSAPRARFSADPKRPSRAGRRAQRPQIASLIAKRRATPPVPRRAVPSGA